MKRREFIQKTSLAASGCFLCRPSLSIGAVNGQKPNILIVIGDDMMWRDCKPYGNPDIHTPNMSRLAKEGICFDSMHTSTAMCAPTRQQLLTGLYPVRNGAYPNHSRVYDGVRSLPYYLSHLGYRVGLIGKRHFGPIESYPFEFISNQVKKNGPTDVKAISEFVNHDKNQPYCLIVASNEPHKPLNRGNPSAYDAEQLTVPPYFVDCPETREELTKYYAEITYLDRQLGDCMSIVDQSNQKENTILIFTSEQGSQIPFGGKWTCNENGLKTAFIVRWPDQIKPDTRTDAMTQYVDLVPTLIEAAGGDPLPIDTGRSDAFGNTNFDGKSFLDVLLGETDTHREYVYGAHTTRGIINGSGCYPIRSVRSKRFHYIRNLNHEAVFYNIESTRENTLLSVWKNRGKSDPKIAARVRLYQHRPAEE